MKTVAEKINAETAGIEDCETAINEGADPADLCRPGQLGADEALINAMGRTWVLEAAGATDETEESWESIALPWCERYSAAFAKRAAELSILPEDA